MIGLQQRSDPHLPHYSPGQRRPATERASAQAWIFTYRERDFCDYQILCIRSITVVNSRSSRNGATAQPPTGLAFAAVPSLSYSSGEGLEYGGKLFFYQYGDGTPQPYRWHLLVNAARSTEQKQDYYAFLDMPHLWGEGSRLDLRIEYKKFGLEDYYGLGNRPDYHNDATQPKEAGFLAEGVL